MVLFSGGLDSTLLAALMCEILPPEIGLDLVNVSFSPEDSPDRITAILSFQQILQRRPKARLICADYKLDDLMQNHELK